MATNVWSFAHMPCSVAAAVRRSAAGLDHRERRGAGIHPEVVVRRARRRPTPRFAPKTATCASDADLPEAPPRLRTRNTRLACDARPQSAADHGPGHAGARDVERRVADAGLHVRGDREDDARVLRRLQADRGLPPQALREQERQREEQGAAHHQARGVLGPARVPPQPPAAARAPRPGSRSFRARTRAVPSQRSRWAPSTSTARLSTT